MGGTRARRPETLVCLILVILTFGAFFRILDHSFVNYDDVEYVTRNAHVTSGLRPDNVKWAFTTFYFANWHPLTWLSHMLDAEIFGANAGRHHLVSLLLHTANALLLFLLFLRMTGACWRSGIVAALFAVHPLHVESVAWVAERKDLLSVFFGFWAVWAYLRYAERPGILRYVPVAVCLALALMAKPMLVTLPFVFLLLDFWPLGRFDFAPDSPVPRTPRYPPAPLRRLLLEKVPLLALSAASCVVTIVAQERGFALTALDHLPLPSRIANALVAYPAYMAKTIWPASLTVFYPLPDGGFPSWMAAGGLLVLASLTALSLRQIGRRPWLAVGWLWYLGTLVPVIGLVQVGAQAMADRYTYLPLIGLFIVVAWGGEEAASRLRISAGVLAGTIAATLLALAVLAWHQAGYWRDSVSLFRHALDVTSGNWVAHNNLGGALVNKGHIDEGIDQFRKALEIRPLDDVAHYNLAGALDNQGYLDLAIRHYSLAIRSNPNNADALNNLARILFKRGRFPEAVILYRDAVRARPDLTEAQYNLGMALSEVGETKEAVVHLREALRLDPNLAEAHSNLGVILSRLGRGEEAVFHFGEAVRIRPGYAVAHHNLGVALRRSGRFEDAVAHLKEALRLDPGNRETLSQLDSALSRRAE